MTEIELEKLGRHEAVYLRVKYLGLDRGHPFVTLGADGAAMRVTAADLIRMPAGLTGELVPAPASPPPPDLRAKAYKLGTSIIDVRDGFIEAGIRPEMAERIAIDLVMSTYREE